MSLLIVILVAISLSMDAFSLSLAYGTLDLEKKSINLLSLIVGSYHFIMPLLGMWFGNKLITILPISTNIIVFIVLLFIGIEMIVDSFKKEKSMSLMKLSELLIFGLAVSLDSFSVGIGLKAIYNNPFISSMIFSISSFIFTYIGLYLGKKINNLIGKVSTVIGGVILIIIGVLYL